MNEFAHLQHPALLGAEQKWSEHVHGKDGRPGCPACQQGERRACPVGKELHEIAVRTAHQLHQEALDERRG